MNLRKHKKFKLLLDEGLPLPKNYPALNGFYNIVHVALSKKLRGKSDEVVYSYAQEKKRIPVVFNTRDYSPLVKDSTISIISLSTNLSNKEADAKICKALKRLKLSQEAGHVISISKTGIVVRKAEEL